MMQIIVPLQQHHLQQRLINMKIRHLSIILLASLFLLSCMSNEVKQQSQRYKGNFRFYSHIAEFFDCKTQEKHYVAESGIYEELIKRYQALGLREKDDVYVSIEGYYQEEEQMDGVDPIDVFIPTKIIKFDTTRSCKRPYRSGL